jgi:hypothetical protein
MKITQEILFETNKEEEIEIKKLDDIFYRGNLMKLYSFMHENIVYISDDKNFMEKYKGNFSSEDVRSNDFDLFYKFIEITKNIEITKTTSDSFNGNYDFYYFNIKQRSQSIYAKINKVIVVVTPETKKNLNPEEKNKIIEKEKNIEENLFKYIDSAKMLYIATKEGGYGDQSIFISKNDSRFKRERYIIEEIKDTKKAKVVNSLKEAITDKENIFNIERINHKTYVIDYKNLIDATVYLQDKNKNNKKNDRNLEMFSFEQLVVMM